ncbi:OmpA family protein [bacterium]|nr:OmpA family protein [bacterium]
MAVKKQHTTNFWISYSDLMAGLLFVLLAIIVISNLQYKQKLQDINENVELRVKIAEALRKKFKEKNIMSVTVEQNGDITFSQMKDVAWFDQESAVLKKRAKSILTEVIPVYLEVLFDDSITKGMLERILIEGHASLEIDKPKQYLKDLDLSEKRAFSVGHYMIDNNPHYYEKLKTHLVTLGRSFADARYTQKNESGKYNPDRVKDRRVLVRFTLKYEKMMQNLTKQ